MIFIAQDQTVFVKKAAQIFLESVPEGFGKDKRASWALCGGNTPQPIFEALAGSYYRERMDWTKLDVFWGDERCVPPDSKDSNYKNAMDALFSKVPVPRSNLHRILGESATAQEAAKAYEQVLKLHFRFERPFPKFDLMVLGVGEDGHTASLFPNTSALDEEEKWVVSHHVQNLPQDRVTLTFPVINNASRILVLCTGIKKATVLRDVFWPEAPQSRYPIQRVKPTQGEIIWLLDREAASKLTADAQKDAKYI